MGMGQVKDSLFFEYSSERFSAELLCQPEYFTWSVSPGVDIPLAWMIPADK